MSGYSTVGSSRHSFNVRRITPADPDYNTTLHLVLGAGLSPAAAHRAGLLEEFLADAERRSLSIDLLFGAYHSTGLAGACLAVESPGATALVLPGIEPNSNLTYSATEAALRVMQTKARTRSIALLELLAPPDARRLGKTVKRAGFHYLTRLIYLQRPCVLPGRTPAAARDLTFVRYSPDVDRLFRVVLERTYAQSLDCPELTGLRSVTQVLAGHRATGEHDPALWSVALRGDEPVGVLLLSRIQRHRAVEIVYMGAAQTARGTGVGSALLARAVGDAAGTSARTMALAVDRRNTPARRLYARWGFAETACRDAWIATSLITRGCEKQGKTRGFPRQAEPDEARKILSKKKHL